MRNGGGRWLRSLETRGFLVESVANARRQVAVMMRRRVPRVSPQVRVVLYAFFFSSPACVRAFAASAVVVCVLPLQPSRVLAGRPAVHRLSDVVSRLRRAWYPELRLTNEMRSAIG